jgi:hypothetical protein
MVPDLDRLGRSLDQRLQMVTGLHEPSMRKIRVAHQAPRWPLVYLSRFKLDAGTV